MFVEIDAKDLVVGTKYAILVSHEAYYHTGIFKAHRHFGRTFHYMKPHENLHTYSILRNMQDMNKHISYYAFVPKKDKIQQAMEQRTLDKILKQLINDDFTW